MSKINQLSSVKWPVMLTFKVLKPFFYFYRILLKLQNLDIKIFDLKGRRVWALVKLIVISRFYPIELCKSSKLESFNNSDKAVRWLITVMNFSICRLIFHRCLSRYEEVSEFDKCTATTSVQCFSEIISLIILHYNSKFSQFLEESSKS